MANEEAAALVVRLEATQARFDRDMRRAVASVERASTAMERRVQGLDGRVAQSFNRVSRTATQGARGFRDMGNAVQQAGFQVGDFAVQVASGGGVLRPFIQQGTQLVSMFGPWGAVVGAAGAVVGALAVSLMEGGDGAQSFEDRLKDLDATMKGMDGLRDQITDLDKLKEKYGEAAQAVIDLMNEERRAERERLSRQAGGLRDDITNAAGTYYGFRHVAGVLGVSRPGSTNKFAMQEVMQGFEQLSAGGSFENVAAAARRTREAIISAVGGMENLNDDAAEIVEKLRKFERTMYDSAATAGDLERSAGDVASNAGDAADEGARLDRNLGGAVSRAGALAGELQKASAALAGMAASAQNRLAAAQLALKFRGDPVGLAKASAEREAGQAVADAQRTMAGDIPSGMTGALLKPLKENAQETVKALTQAAEIEERIAALNKADSAGGGGGGGRASAAEKAADAINREVESIQKKLGVLQQERALLEARAAAQGAGATPEELARQQEVLTAAFDRQRIVRELLNKAEQEGIDLTPAQRAEVEALAAQTEALTIANFDLNASIDAQAKASEDAARRQEELARGLSQVADRFVGAIQQADSFTDALKRIGIELLNIAVQGIGGQGPLGSVLGGIGKALIGGIAGALGGGFATPNFTPGPASLGSLPNISFNAKGGAFSAGREITPFAAGGIVSSPTVFPMANGMGLMGEAGPEAILPLRRGPGGRLGVEAASGRQMVELVVGYSKDAEVRVLRQSKDVSVRVTQQGIKALRDARAEDYKVMG